MLKSSQNETSVRFTCQTVEAEMFQLMSRSFLSLSVRQEKYALKNTTLGV